MRRTRSHIITLAAGLLGASLLTAKGGKTPPAPDRIEVIAHIPLSGSHVVHLTMGTHWRRDYIYLDRGSGSPVVVFDVTHPAAPKETGTLAIPSQGARGDVTAVVGTAVLVGSVEPAPAPQAVTIMSFADAEHPKVVQQFSGVTAMLKDEARGLIYLANPDGLWVLRLNPATDVEAEEEYEHYVRYNP